ncbi:PilZ domain-containing protein [Anoxybacillus vitaminiphilus]|uniref:PilZ domain-containing protein n=1 Tax=Paranoxybacillus vitaminiphilus TaxID=581036 RepID=A0A327YCZ6_9BACL|nr:PilZ domain-containing protein [Anoxybacillus vitaminiphilus]RAK18863.1 PilZ domain-containing protein [Anoxybacillus vitaminiphilus]
MRFKRQEAFRYEFGQPLPCTFRIVQVGEKKVETDKGKAEIHDISPKGMKIGTPLNIPLDKKIIIIEITFTLSELELTVLGKLVWQRKFANDYFYGVNLILSHKEERQLIDELKKYAANYYKRSSSNQ